MSIGIYQRLYASISRTAKTPTFRRFVVIWGESPQNHHLLTTSCGERQTSSLTRDNGILKGYIHAIAHHFKITDFKASDLGICIFVTTITTTSTLEET